MPCSSADANSASLGTRVVHMVAGFNGDIEATSIRAPASLTLISVKMASNVATSTRGIWIGLYLETNDTNPTHARAPNRSRVP